MSSHGPAPEFTNPVVKWVEARLPIFSFLHMEYRAFPMPRNVNYLWSFGALAMITLVVMIVTGIMLAMQYTAHVDMAFDSVERIMRDVNYGWLLRYIHMNGASMFFIVVYIHIGRGLYYGSYKAPRELLWLLGVVILILMMGTAFMGYVLPWGQMSLWGATVITNLFSAIPLIGEDIVTLLWGGFAVDNPTLNRFFALHYLLPFLILGVVILHVAALHVVGSNNPLGIEPKGPQDTVMFHPYVTAKDTIGIGVYLLVFAGLVFYAPNFLGHPDNYIPADPLVTPTHIVPEWYFLPYYAILRSFVDGWWIHEIFFGWWATAKLAGVIAMFGSLLMLAVIPWLDTSPVRSCRFRPWYKIAFWLFVIDFVILGWVGGMPAEEPYVTIAQGATMYYFFHFLILTPMIGWLERPKPLPASIGTPVLKSTGGQSVEQPAE